MVYYNENEPFAAEWLRNLIAAGHIAHGDVDERSIEDVQPSDLKGYGQCHFFAGIGVWSYALRCAGWPDDRPVWTGSCPCQPFSVAGRRKGSADARHLWPTWFRLIEKCRPPVVFGEQVANGDGLGWFDAVQADLEGEGYAVGAADLCAAGVGAPHIRQRLYFVAVAGRELARGRIRRSEKGSAPDDFRASDQSGRSSGSRIMGDSGGARGGRDARTVFGEKAAAQSERQGSECRDIADESVVAGVTGFWRDADLIYCRDGKHRPVEPGTFPLAHGTPQRVGRLRAYGNALAAPVAEAFVRAYLG